MRRIFIEKRNDGTLFIHKIGGDTFDKEIVLKILEEAVACIKTQLELEVAQ